MIACSPKYKNPHVRMETKFGDIEVELFPDQAPKSVVAFLSYVDSGYYKKAAFYRVLRDDEQPMDAPKAELIQLESGKQIISSPLRYPALHMKQRNKQKFCTRMA